MRHVHAEIVPELRNSRAPRVMILGATSSIAQEAAYLYAAEGASLLLVGRRQDALSVLASELEARGAAEAEIVVTDLVAEEDPAARFREFVGRLHGADHILLTYGMLGDQTKAENDYRLAAEILSTNFTSAAVWILSAAAYLESRRQGSLVVLGSLAGDRIRGKMLLYGAAKAGLAALMQGIADRLEACGARAILIKPGPTETPMVQSLKTPRRLRAAPRLIGAVVHKASRQQKSVIYAPGYWRWIMLIARMIPARIFRRSFA